MMPRGRYAILYLYGGFYMDLDIECRRPLDFLRSYPFVMPQTRPVGFSNDFLAAAPGHPFLRQLLAALPSWNLWLLSKYPTVMFSTGPMFVSYQVQPCSFRCLARVMDPPHHRLPELSSLVAW